MKNFLFSFFLLFMSFSAMAQMYVTWNGNVGIGTTTPSCKFQINSSFNNFTFKPYNSGNLEIGGYDGNSNSNIIFWHSQAGYNTLTAKSFTKSSDSTLKKEMHLIDNPLGILRQINGYSYYYSEDPSVRGKKDYGVIAQEVEKVIPELVDSVKGIKVVDYDGLLPFLIEAVKVQQTQIETLTQEVVLLKQSINLMNDDKAALFSIQEEQQEMFPVVCQNIPNPFNTTTTIKCYVPKNVVTSILYIYDSRGGVVKSITIKDRGEVFLHIQSNEFSSGVYAYVLVCDGVTSEAKQMILTR